MQILEALLMGVGLVGLLIGLERGTYKKTILFLDQN